jgi:hypothetical protein
MPKSPSRSRRAKPGKGATGTSEDGPKLIDEMFRDLPDWRGETLARLRALIHEVDPDVVEEIKWRKPSNPDGVPVWSHHGILCTANVWKDHVRLTFAKGGLLKDPRRVFNASLNGNFMRALDLREGDTFDDDALRALLRAAIALNGPA